MNKNSLYICLFMFLISIITSSIIIAASGIVFINDNYRCELIDLKIEKVCNLNNKLTFKVSNQDENPIFLRSSSDNLLGFRINGNSKADYSKQFLESKVEIIPFIYVDNNYYKCNSKKLNYNILEVPKC